MNSPEAAPANQTTVKRMAIILILAFLGSQLNIFIILFGQLAGGLLDSNNSGHGLFSLFSYDLAAGLKLAAIVFLFAWGNFLMLSLYPEHGFRQVAAGFLGAVVLVVCLIISTIFLPYDLRSLLQIIGFLAAIMACLLVSGRVKRLPDLAGMGLGLLTGIELCMIGVYFSNRLTVAPIWLSAVFFLEMLSRRANRNAAFIGGFLWIGLMALEALLVRFLYS
jgi:hypothetical protein